jgi:hypothetical protein
MYLSWYCLADWANAKLLTQRNPTMIYASQADNLQLYKITLENSPFYHVLWTGKDGQPTLTTGFTAWGVKILAPWDAVNTDGIDPIDNISQVVIADSYISNGDDNIAISARTTSYPATYMTVQNMHTYSGRGISIGSETQGGVNNILMQTVEQDGTYMNPNLPSGPAGDVNETGFRIKSDEVDGGVVSDVVYSKFCQQNENYAFRLQPKWDGQTGSSLPTFGVTTNGVDHPIMIQNSTFIPHTPGGASAIFDIEGLNPQSNPSNISLLYLQNVQIAGNNSTATVSSSTDNTNLVNYIDTNATALENLETGRSGVYMYSDAPNTIAAQTCNADKFPTYMGELFATTSSSNPTGANTNLTTLSMAPGATITLTSVFEYVSEEEAAVAGALGPVTFYQNTTDSTSGGTQLPGSPTAVGNVTNLSVTVPESGGPYYYYSQAPSNGIYPYAVPSTIVTVNLKQ